MKLKLIDNGNRKDSNDLFEYLMNYMYSMVKSLEDQNCLYTAKIINAQIYDLRMQHLKALADNKIVIGWQ